MKTKVILLTIITLVAGIVSTSAKETLIIKNNDKTIGIDMTPIVLAIFTQHEKGDFQLSFEKGEYHFYPEFAYAEYHAVTNHDNSYKSFAFPIKDMKNVEIDGNGSKFIFHGVITPFLVMNSSNIVMHDLTIDWEEPFYIQGKVLSSTGKESMEMEFTGFSKYSLDGSIPVLENNGQKQYFLGENMVFDPKTSAVIYNASDYLMPDARTAKVTAEKINGNIYRINGRFVERPAPTGSIYVFKGPNGNNRLVPAIHICGSEKFSAKHINIHHAGGMGVIAEKSSDIHLNNVNVCLEKGTDRIVTTTADATHFCNCRGKLIVENCLFENMLDDAINVHGTYLKVEKIKDSRTLIARTNHPQQHGFEFAQKGDKIQIVSKGTILPVKTVRVKKVKIINQTFTELTFDQDIKDIVKPGDGLENITWYPELIFKNNIVRNNRARSVLISSGKKAIIENNFFSSMMTSILFEGDLDYWFESGAVSDVIIRNNTFGDSCYGGRKASIIWINPHVKEMPENEYYEKNIIIENNVFNTFDRSILDAKSVNGLVFKNNTIKPSDTYLPLYPELPEIKIEHCSSLELTDNIFEGSNTRKTAECSIDKHSNARKVSTDQAFNNTLR